MAYVYKPPDHVRKLYEYFCKRNLDDLRVNTGPSEYWKHLYGRTPMTAPSTYLKTLNGRTSIEEQAQHIAEIKTMIAENVKEEQKMTNSNEFDIVTLLQLEQGAKLVSVNYLPQGKGDRSQWTFKTQLDLAKGDYVLVLNNNGQVAGAVVTDVEPELERGIKYSWIIQKLDKALVSQFTKLDKEADKKLAINRAIREAKEAHKLDNTDVKLLPQVSDGDNASLIENN